MEEKKIVLYNTKAAEVGKNHIIKELEKKANQVEKQNSTLAKNLSEANEKLSKRNGMHNNGQNSLAFSMNPFGMSNLSMMNQQLQMQRQFNISAIPQVNSSGVFNNGQSTNFNIVGIAIQYISANCHATGGACIIFQDATKSC